MFKLVGVTVGRVVTVHYTLSSSSSSGTVCKLMCTRTPSGVQNVSGRNFVEDEFGGDEVGTPELRKSISISKDLRHWCSVGGSIGCTSCPNRVLPTSKPSRS